MRIILSNEARLFLHFIPPDASNKIIYNLRKVQSGVKDKELFKKLESTNIWEFRTLFNGIAYRLFAFWDTEQETMVIATHGIVKKDQRTPKKEIKKPKK